MKMRAGIGAKCSIYTKYLTPTQTEFANQNDHRSDVVLIAHEIQVQKNGKQKKRYLCTITGSDDILSAPHNRFKIIEEGAVNNFFVPLTEEEKEQKRQTKTSAQFKEPKIKWKKSEAKRELYHLILDGVISDADNESEDLLEIYQMSMKFGLYDFGKFKARLTALRKKIHELNDCAAEDLLAFENYKSNHEVSLFTHKGNIQWQGSDAQELLKEG
jgi:hypothetical protein